MFYLGANDSRVTLVDDHGHEVYNTDFRNFINVLTHLRPLIRAICIANPVGDVDKNLLKIFDDQMKKEKNFHSLTALSMAPLDSKLLALTALARAQSPTRTAKTSPPAKTRKK